MDRPLGENAQLKYNTTVGGFTYEIEINDDSHVMIDGKQYDVDFQAVSGQALYSVLIGGRSHDAYVEAGDSGWLVLHQGNLHKVQVQDERSQRLAQLTMSGPAYTTGEFSLKAPMPGLVVSVPVNEGETVRQGDVLIILESMKMQNELKAPHDGTVARVQVAEGDSVNLDQSMVVLA